MAEFILPGLSQNAAITPGTAGQWDPSDGTQRFLQGLSDGLVVATSKNHTENIDSIPDVWARPMFFQMALYSDDANNNFDAALHKKARGEWRALLAMFALKDVRSLNLTVDAVHLDGAQGDPLTQMLRSLAPTDSVAGNGQADWNDIYVISFDGALLAITSPSTLIAPAADYAKGTFTEPWSVDGHHLTDPIPNLAPKELGGLHNWLDTLENKLRQTISLDVQQNNPICRQLFNAIDSYKNDVLKAVGGNLGATDGIVGAKLGMKIGIFQHLDQTVKPPTVTAASSAVLIRTSEARKKSKSLLLVSPTMLDEFSMSWGIPKPQIVIWGGITAVNINEQALSGGHSMINGVALKNAEWRRPEDFFTERLVVYGRDNVFANVRNVRGSDSIAGAGWTVFLPLRQEILDYFTPDEIAQNLLITDAGSSFDVEFTFPLGADDSNLSYTMKKSYPKQEPHVIALNTTVPVVEIWPDFKRKGWEKYYLYYENPEAQNNPQGIGSGFFYVYPWAYGQKIAGDTPPRGLWNLYTARLSGFPEALICSVNVKDNDGVHDKTLDAGLVLLNEPRTVQIQTGKHWQVGIDFGTSGTMLYCREGNKNPKPLTLKPHLFQVTDSEDLRNRTYRNFIPSSTADQQAGSLLSIYQQLVNVDAGVAIRPLQDGNVFWLLSAEGEDAEDFRNNSSRIDANLKWKNDASGQQRVEAFIKQICLQSSAEAAQNEVDTIAWNCSYPTAFSVNQRLTFNQTCEIAVADAVQNSGLNLSTVSHWAESKATAYCFRKSGGNNLAGGAVCCDIGAGTADISIVSGTPSEIVYHTSLQFAGRYLFRSIYKNHARFADRDLTFGEMDDEKKNALIDADMRKHGKRYLDNLRYKGNDSHVEKALQIAQFAAAGLFYYLGSLVDFLHKKHIYKEDNVPEIYIGGNGSRIFSWICGGTFTNDSPYVDVFKDLFVGESGLTGNLNIVLSKTPKVEVACGMVEDKPPNDAAFFNPLKQAVALFGEKGRDPLIADSLFAGDAFAMGTEEHSKTDFISAYELKEGVIVRRVDELCRFLDKFNERNHHIRALNQRITISDRQRDDVARAVSGVYHNQIGRDEQDIFVEPVFILELKKFVEMLC